MKKLLKIIKFYYIIMNFTTSELIIGIASVFIFFYRMIVVMFPMLKDAWERKDIGDGLKSLTLLV